MIDSFLNVRRQSNVTVFSDYHTGLCHYESVLIWLTSLSQVYVIMLNLIISTWKTQQHMKLLFMNIKKNSIRNTNHLHKTFPPSWECYIHIC